MTTSIMAKLNAYGITDGMVTSTVITIILILVCILGTRKMNMVPTGFQNIAELSIGNLYKFFGGIIGAEANRRYFAWICTIFIYVLFCNYSGLLPGAGVLPGLKPPTASINCAMAMAVVTFLMTQFEGIRANRGLKYYKYMAKPFVFMIPLMIIEMFVRPLSLTMRLYGNVFGEETVVHSFFEMIPIGLPVVMQFLSVLMGLIQALVFALLSAIYVSEAGEIEEEEGHELVNHA